MGLLSRACSLMQRLMESEGSRTLGPGLCETHVGSLAVQVFCAVPCMYVCVCVCVCARFRSLPFCKCVLFAFGKPYVRLWVSSEFNINGDANDS